MVDVVKNLHDVQKRLSDDVCLTAISKHHPRKVIASAHAAGQRVSGEGRKQGLAEKAEALPNNTEWHPIRHLQTNKVKYIAPYISMIESVSSPKLLREISEHAARSNRVIDTSSELYIAEEAIKYGFTLDRRRDFLEVGGWRELPNVRIYGLMVMASNVDDERQMCREMLAVKDSFNEVKERCFTDQPFFKQRSWSINHGYLTTVTCGSIMVRADNVASGER